MNFFKLRGHKYGAQKTSRKVERAGYSFASKAEAELFDWLHLRQRNGEISNLKTQVCVYLTKARILYKPDFSFEENGETVFAEFKGFETDMWKLKRRLWKAGYGPAKLEVWKKSGKNLILAEVIFPKGEVEDE